MDEVKNVLVGVSEPGSDTLPVPVKVIVVKPGSGFGVGSSVVMLISLLDAFVNNLLRRIHITL